jgi:hypothetical protein
MPPNNPSNPDTAQGKRKRRPTERLTNNADPLLAKKARVTHSRRGSVEDVDEPVPPPRPQPRNPSRIIESDEDDDEPQFPNQSQCSEPSEPIDISDDEDADVQELGEDYY